MSLLPDFELCRRIVARHPYPLLFATVSGAHLYGFPSPDSDYDLRGVHILPAEEVLSLETPRETVESAGVEDGVEIDLVTHDAAKFFGLMLKKNGYVLEQLLSPLVVVTTPEHEELRALAAWCITRHHAHHYLGFAETQWNLFAKESPPRVKPLLYVYRVLLTGIHLMRTGVVEANLPRLNEEYKLPCVEELIARKVGGEEKGVLSDADMEFHEREYRRLRARLEAEYERCKLPEGQLSKRGLSELLVRLRLKGTAAFRAKEQEIVQAGQRVVHVDGRMIAERGLHAVFAEIFGFPDYYGRNMHAWIDCMTYIDDPTMGMTTVSAPPGGIVVIEIDHADELMRRCPDVFAAIVECAAIVNLRRLELGERAVLAMSYRV